jgi:hypothetical protein
VNGTRSVGSATDKKPARSREGLSVETQLAFVQGPGKFAREAGKSLGNPELVDQLFDLGVRRIADMDSSGIDAQVVSLTAPGVEQVDPAEATAHERESRTTKVDEVIISQRAGPTNFP